MKPHLFLLFVFFIITSCENTETNDIVLQADLDGRFYEANGAIAIKNEDGTFFIHGLTTKETVILKLSGPQEGIYELGGVSDNYGAFEDFNGNLYLSNPNGEGQIIVSKWDQTNETLTGTFEFKAILPGVDTLFVEKGIFYQIPYGVEPVALPDPDVDGFFLAEIDGVPFSPSAVNAEETETSIIVTASENSETITLGFPIAVQTGNVVLPQPGFIANYTDENGMESALSGNIIIITHEPSLKQIKGTFSFETETHSVSLGQFNVTYE